MIWNKNQENSINKYLELHALIVKTHCLFHKMAKFLQDANIVQLITQNKWLLFYQINYQCG